MRHIHRHVDRRAHVLEMGLRRQASGHDSVHRARIQPTPTALPGTYNGEADGVQRGGCDATPAQVAAVNRPQPCSCCSVPRHPEPVAVKDTRSRSTARSLAPHPSGPRPDHLLLGPLTRCRSKPLASGVTTYTVFNTSSSHLRHGCESRTGLPSADASSSAPCRVRGTTSRRSLDSRSPRRVRPSDKASCSPRRPPTRTARSSGWIGTSMAMASSTTRRGRWRNGRTSRRACESWPSR